MSLLKPDVLLVAIQCTRAVHEWRCCLDGILYSTSPVSQAFGDLLGKSELQHNRSELI